MQLSKRLQAVADLITPGSRVADVGCDHAYVSIYLAEHHISPHIIAMDVNQGPIDRAKENILKYGYSSTIETRRSNGLEKLEMEETDTILIAGMGGALAIQILNEKSEVMSSAAELVLQPQSEIYKVRQFLQDKGYIMIRENMIQEDGKFYVMLKAVKIEKVKNSSDYLLTGDEHFHFGRLLLEERNAVLKEFLLWDYHLCEGIIETLEQSQTDQSLVRQKEIADRMKLIQSALAYYKE